MKKKKRTKQRTNKNAHLKSHSEYKSLAESSKWDCFTFHRPLLNKPNHWRTLQEERPTQEIWDGYWSCQEGILKGRSVYIERYICNPWRNNQDYFVHNITKTILYIIVLLVVYSHVCFSHKKNKESVNVRARTVLPSKAPVQRG